MSITTGAQLTTFITGLNAEAQIDATLLDVLVDTARTVIEEERPWMVLRKTNTSLTLTAGANAAKDMSGITDFSRFYSDTPIKLYDGDNRVDYFRLVPFDRRLEYKDHSNTVCFDEANKLLYFNGNVAFAGTLYIDYVATSTAIDLTSESAVWTPFPSRFLPLLGFYAIGIFKGAVDYDSINREMLPENRSAMQALKQALEKWDNERQLSSLEFNDPTELFGGGHRDGAINRF